MAEQIENNQIKSPGRHFENYKDNKQDFEQQL